MERSLAEVFALSTTFLKFYHEDGLKHLIKNVEYWINNSFKDII